MLALCRIREHILNASDFKVDRSLYYRAESIVLREAILSAHHGIYLQSILSIL